MLLGCTAELPEPSAVPLARQGTHIDATLPREHSDAAVPPVDAGPDSAGAEDAAVDGPEPDVADPDAGPLPDAGKPECRCAPDEGCVAGECVRARWTFESESAAMTHQTGTITDVGWGASALFDEVFTFLQRGPDADDIPAGTYDAVFYLRVGLYFADVDAAYLDVNDLDGSPGDCLDCSLAAHAVRTAEFSGPGVFRAFTLRFENPGARRLEFRAFFVGLVDVEIDRVEVLRVFER